MQPSPFIEWLANRSRFDARSKSPSDRMRFYQEPKHRITVSGSTPPLVDVTDRAVYHGSRSQRCRNWVVFGESKKTVEFIGQEAGRRTSAYFCYGLSIMHLPRVNSMPSRLGVARSVTFDSGRS